MTHAMLGATNVRLSRLGVGGHTFLSRYGGMDRADRQELIRIVETAISQGINFFDVTWDEEREVFGSLVRELGIRGRIFLSCWMSSQKTRTGTDVRAEAQRAVSLLGVDRVDLLYLDWTATSEQLDAMMDLRKNGLTRFIGILGTETAMAANLQEVDAVLVNHNYYLRNKESGILSLARARPGLGIISLEPMGRGRFPSGSAPAGVDMAVASLKYALGFEAAHAVLVGVRRLAQLEQDIQVWKGDYGLSPGERGALAAGLGYEIPSPA